MREAFENALRDNPDDLAGWCAFADWLVEQGDPLGEFMQVQIALESESRPKKERDRLKKRETELLKAHEPEWLGELTPFLLGSEPEATCVWRRGFLAKLDVRELTIDLEQALASSPAVALLHELRIRNGELGGSREWLDSPCAGSVRVLLTGNEDDEPSEDGWCDCHSHISDLELLLTSLPRAEEFRLLSNSVRLRTVFASSNLTRLRVLRAYHIGEDRGPGRYYEYPLDALAANPAFGNLTHLQFHPHFQEGTDAEGNGRSFIPLKQVRALVRSPHLTKLTHLQLRLSDMGDGGVREIIASGVLKRLKWLDLRHGCVTDEGARLFAACPDAKGLERLDLSRNAVTTTGLATLRAAGINAVANRPQTQGELDDRQYLREGDFE